LLAVESKILDACFWNAGGSPISYWISIDLLILLRRDCSNMKKQTILMSAFIVVLVSGALLLLPPFDGAPIRFESAEPDSTGKIVEIHLTNFHDSLVDIFFVENDSLVYDLSIELFEEFPSESLFNIDQRELSDKYLLSLNKFDENGSMWTAGSSRLKSVTLVLSSSREYSLNIYSEGILNTTVEYTNGANLGGGSEFVYIAKGGLNFTLDEQVTIEDGMFQVIISTNELELSLDLPNHVAGQVVFSSLGFIQLIEWDGWLVDEEHSNVLETSPMRTNPSVFVSATTELSTVRLKS
jgi:hypothetical protein